MIEDIGRGIKYNALGKSIFILTGLLISILIVRGIGKEEYGLFIFVMTIFMLLSPLYNLGLTVPLTRYVSEYRTKGELGKIRTLILKSLKLKLLSWIIVSPVVLYLWRYLYPETFTIAIILVFIALLTAINSTFSSSLESFYEQKLLNTVAIIRNILYLLLVLLVVAFIPSIEMVILAGLIPPLLVSIFLGRRIRDVIDVAPKTIKEDKKRIAKFAIAAMLAGIISYITYEKSEVVLLGAYRTKGEVASYGLAYDFALRIPNLITMVIGSLHYVSMTELYTKNPAELRNGIKKFEKFIFLFGIPMCVWSFIEAENLIMLLYGSMMLDAVFPFRVILILITVNLLLFPINSVIGTLEKQPLATSVGAIFAVVNIALDILLIPKYGINGALFAVCIFFISNIVFWITCAYKWIGNFIPIRSITKFLVSSIPIFILLFFTESICEQVHFLIIFSFIGLIIYLFMLKITKALSDEDKNILSKIDLPFVNNIIKLM